MSHMPHEMNIFDQFVNGDYRVLLPLIKINLLHYDTCDKHRGESLLIWGCRHGYNDLIELVVEKGCDINHVAPSDGLTAVDICQERGDLLMVIFLRNDGGLSRAELLCDVEAFICLSAPAA